MNCSSSLRRSDRWRVCCSSAISSVRKKFWASCWVIVLAPTRYVRLPLILVDERAHHADRIDAGVMVETPILDRQDGLPHHACRDAVQGRPAPLLAARVHQRGEHRGIEA